MSIQDLWAKNKFLVQYCEPLFCSGKIYQFLDILTYTVVTDSLQENDLCAQYSNKIHSFGNSITFSIDISDIARIVFLVGQKDNIDRNKAKFLTLFHYSNESELTECCTEIPRDHYLISSKSNSLICYSLKETCKSPNYLWHNSEIFPDNFIIILKENVMHSKLFPMLSYI